MPMVLRCGARVDESRALQLMTLMMAMTLMSKIDGWSLHFVLSLACSGLCWVWLVVAKVVRFLPCFLLIFFCGIILVLLNQNTVTVTLNSVQNGIWSWPKPYSDSALSPPKVGQNMTRIITTSSILSHTFKGINCVSLKIKQSLNLQ